DRAARSPIGIEILRRVIHALGCKEAVFEIYNLLLLRGRWRRIRLCVAECCVHRLAEQTGFTPIPHDRAQEPQVGRGKRAPVNRDDPARWAELAGSRVCIAIIGGAHEGDVQFSSCGKWKPNSKQSLAQQQAVGLQLVLQRRDVRGGTINSIDEAEYWIVAGTRVKSVLHTLGADRPGGLRLMAGEACAPIGSKVLKKCIAGCLRVSVWLIR